MIERIKLNISGTSFLPHQLVNSFQNAPILLELSDLSKVGNSSQMGTSNYGSLSICNPTEFSYMDDSTEYEEWYLNFLTNYYQKILQYPFEYMNMHTEIFYTGGQCNFEILNKELIFELNKFNLSYLVSVYLISDEEYRTLLPTK